MLSYIIFFVLGYLFCKYAKPIQQKLFPMLIDRLNQDISNKFVEWKAEKLAGIKKMKSYFPEMQAVNSIKILEIGVGTGMNFSLYPDNCHLTVVDPNPNFREYYNANRSKYPQIKSEEIIVCGAEDMYAVPDCSVDAVVVSWVLCSVKDIPKIMQQVLRVLVPGGKLFFFEHIKEWDRENKFSTIILQNIVTMSGLYPLIFDGCQANREILPHILGAGFTKVDYEREYAPIDGMEKPIITPHCYGVATK